MGVMPRMGGGCIGPIPWYRGGGRGKPDPTEFYVQEDARHELVAHLNHDADIDTSLCVSVPYQSLESKEGSFLLGIIFRLALWTVNLQPIGQIHLTHHLSLWRHQRRHKHKLCNKS